MNSSPRSLRALVLLLAAPAAFAAAAPIPTPAKTHVLFMGAEIAVERDKKFYRVEDIAGSNFKIRIGAQEVLVPTRHSASQLRIDHALKLGGPSATLGKLVAERVYTRARDPRRQLEAESGAAGGAAAAADLANIQVQQAEAAFIYGGASNPRAPTEYVEHLKALAEDAKRGQLNAMAQLESEQSKTPGLAERMQIKVSAGNFDAIEVAFEVSSSVPLDEPYLLVIARIREPDARPGLSRNWIYAQALEPIGPEPRFLRVREAGFPPGFHLDDCQVRIYNRGREVPTNISPKRVELTRDEALQYLLMEHQAAHKGATLGATPAFSPLPSDLPGRIAAGEYTQAYYVKVDASGNARGVFLDQAGTRPVRDPYLDRIFADMLFAPALEQGRPVEGIARVRLGELR